MGCAPSRPAVGRAEEPAAVTVRYDSESFPWLDERQLKLISEGNARDRQRMDAIIQLSLQLSLDAIKDGHTEKHLCEAAVAARKSICAADRMSIWRVRQQQAASPPTGSNGNGGDQSGARVFYFVCLASDSVGMTGRKAEHSEASLTLVASLQEMDGTARPQLPLVIDGTEAAARAELQGRYGPCVRAGILLPIIAQPTSSIEVRSGSSQHATLTK